MKTILLIEPDSVQLAATKQVLESTGHSVYVSQTAEQAISQAETVQFDVVILELQLQTHGGVEFLHEFRSYADWQAIPVILYTMVPGYVLEPYKSQLNKLGVVAHMYKPDTPLEMLLKNNVFAEIAI